MRRLVVPGLTLVLALGAVLTATLLRTPRAEACGGFFDSASLSAARRPSLAHEQVLIVYDPKSQREHFIREVVFRRATQPFGFVVPTPSRPEVAKVDKSPFAELRGKFDFDDRKLAKGARGLGLGGGIGAGASAGVSILDVQKVGSFTAFVLAATDEKGLADWLRKQKLVSTKEADTWLAHYVRMGFFYVAMRYDPEPLPAGKKPTEEPPAKAETLRISFSTPVPYYPYFEPVRPALPDELRLLDLWVASSEAFRPVALLERGGSRHWVRPMREGARFNVAQAELREALGSELSRLLPQGDLGVQTFQDQKVSRTGFGDVLFVSEKPRTRAPDWREHLGRLLGVLDPELVPVSR